VAWATVLNGTEYYEEGKDGFASLSALQTYQQCDPQTSANINRELFMQTINPYYLNKYFSMSARDNNLAFVWKY
jgi:hypothetical protein